MRHSGDHRDGSSAPFDEEITIDLSDNRKIANITGFAFVVNAHSGESLSLVTDAKITFLDRVSNQILREASILKGVGAGVVAALLWNTGAEWEIAFPNTPSKGTNFQDSVSDVQKAIKKHVLGDKNNAKVDDRIQRSYVLQKQQVVDIAGPPSEDAPMQILSSDGDDLLIGCESLRPCRRPSPLRRAGPNAVR